MFKVNSTLDSIEEWITNKGMEVAREKTKAILLIGRKKHSPITFWFGDTELMPKPTLKYLGVV